MGAFLTIGLAADAPGRLAAAAITAGGIVEAGEAAAPSRARARSTVTPFCILHGSADTTVPPMRARLFETLLKEKNVPHEFQLFEGVGHNLHSSRFEEVNARIRAWFQRFATPPGG
jgi:predicted esterase